MKDKGIIENIRIYKIMGDFLIRLSVISVLGAGNTSVELQCCGL
jgi:hypothetical protein